MRISCFVFLLACGSPKPEPAEPDRSAAACRDLDSPDLVVRVAATRQLEPKIGRVEGGTEQQMDAEPTKVGYAVVFFNALYGPSYRRSDLLLTMATHSSVFFAYRPMKTSIAAERIAQLGDARKRGVIYERVGS